tara:strand:- start:221 stop:388 length:168 start_codon:yes stop_codon:yes gene_type:complete
MIRAQTAAYVTFKEKKLNFKVIAAIVFDIFVCMGRYLPEKITCTMLVQGFLLVAF